MKSKNQVRIYWIKGTVIFCSILAAIFFILFLIHQHYDANETLATDVVGQYGDFIGGVVGTLLSIVLLYYTFKSQIEEAAKNTQVNINHQFGETFYQLLSQYNSILNNLTVKIDDTDEKLYGKEALHYIYDRMRNDYDTGENNSRKAAIVMFFNFYSSYIDFAPIYFRTLYRIFDLIDNSKISEEDKVRYAKIVRCQLTDSETIFLRYDAFTFLGENMRQYISEFNLFKHLLPLNILEYHKWRTIFPVEQRNNINIILYNIRHYLHKLLTSGNKNLTYTSSRAKYNINLSTDKDNKQIKMDFNRRTNVIIPLYDDFSCLDAVIIDDIEFVFEKWILEIFYLQNYGKKNKNIRFERTFVPFKNHKEHFTILIKRANGDSLEI